MTTDIALLANAAVQGLQPYQPGKPITELERETGITHAIKLASNENPLGASQHVIKAIHDAVQHIHVYPDGSGYELKAKLAQHHHVHANQITLGNGSDNNIELIIKTFLNDGDTAVISEYAFMTIPLLIQACGAKAIIAKANHYAHDVESMLASVQANTRLLFIVNPNNPTGTYMNAHDFHALMKALPSRIIVVIDEAYIEYIDVDDFPDSLAALKHYPNLIIVRTFSKAYGLAGIRLGYTVSSPEIADLLNRVRLPFNVNRLANAAGLAALDDQAHIEKTIALNRLAKQKLINGLQALSLAFIPSVGNFISVDVGKASAVYEGLLKQGVIVRPLTAYQLPKHIRISIGSESDIDRCLHALKQCLFKE